MHFFREEHLEEVCPRCYTLHHKRWKSQFVGEFHYKTLDCPTCTYKLYKRTDRLTSGYE